jgi:hypothetical protein
VLHVVLSVILIYIGESEEARERQQAFSWWRAEWGGVGGSSLEEAELRWMRRWVRGSKNSIPEMGLCK